MFGSIDGGKGTGWDIAALSDQNGDYTGRCKLLLLLCTIFRHDELSVLL
jgi:hypothetical protein